MISESTRKAPRAWILASVCICVLISILVAGLWPFHSPKNQVIWVKRGNGVRFGEYGTILSLGTFQMRSSQGPASYSFEIWLQPGLTVDTNTFLAFYTPESPVSFSMHQSNTDLVLQGGSQTNDQATPAKIYVDNVFRQAKQVFITITLGPEGSTVYIDGALVRKFHQFRPSTNDFRGQLVIGDSPVKTDTWSGQLQGLAIYNRELTAPQVLRHYKTWTAEQRPQVAENENLVAAYLFHEQAGNVVHNEVRGGIDLYIPAQYMILHEKFLEPPWEEFRADWGYWKNVLINIGGFIPLGLFFCAYLSWVRQVKHAALATVILGGAVSLAIEIFQAYLPTRQSGMTDLITNILGTYLGVMLYRWTATEVPSNFLRRASTTCSEFCGRIFRAKSRSNSHSILRVPSKESRGFWQPL
jgi:hypothetical protein